MTTIIAFVFGMLFGCVAATVVLISTKAVDYDDYYDRGK